MSRDYYVKYNKGGMLKTVYSALYQKNVAKGFILDKSKGLG